MSNEPPMDRAKLPLLYRGVSVAAGFLLVVLVTVLFSAGYLWLLTALASPAAGAEPPGGEELVAEVEVTAAKMTLQFAALQTCFEGPFSVPGVYVLELTDSRNRLVGRAKLTVTPSQAGSQPAVLITREAESADRVLDTTPENQSGAGDRGDALDVEASPDSSGGLNVSFWAPSEWLEYDVETVAAAYTFTLTVASPAAGGVISLEIDGESYGVFTVGATGGWFGWETYTILVDLEAGPRVIRLTAVSANPAQGHAANFDKFTLAPAPVP